MTATELDWPCRFRERPNLSLILAENTDPDEVEDDDDDDEGVDDDDEGVDDDDLDEDSEEDD